MNERKQSVEPLVSIITVVLNDKDGLQRTIQSVRKQTYANIEYIVIDGGSSDGTVDILHLHLNEIDAWISEPDKGIADAFNKGLALANGEVIGILNAGDRYYDDAVATIVEEYKRCETPDTFFCSGHMRVNEWDMILYADAGYARKLPFMMPLINHPTCFVSASVYRLVGGFNTNIAIAMDYEFLKRCDKAGIAIQCLNKLLVEIDAYGMSNKQFWRSYRELLAYSDNKLLTLIVGPLMAYNRIRIKRRVKRLSAQSTAMAAK